MIILILAGLIPSAVVAIVVAALKRSCIKGALAGAILLLCWIVILVAALVIHGDPALPGSRIVTKEEMRSGVNSPGHHTAQLPSEGR